MSEAPEGPRKLDFSADAKALFGPVLADIERLDELFSEQSTDHLIAHPDACRTLFDQAAEPLKQLCKRFRDALFEGIYETLSPGEATKPRHDFDEIFSKLFFALAHTFPDYLKSDYPSAQKHFLNIAVYHALAELVAYVMTHKGDNRTNRIRQMASSAAKKDPYDANPVIGVHREISQAIEFFRGHPVRTEFTEHLSADELRDMNKRIFRTICAERNFHDVPLSVSQDHDISTAPLLLTSDEAPPLVPEICGLAEAELSLFDNKCADILLTPIGLEKMRVKMDPKERTPRKIIFVGESLNLFIARHDGELSGMHMTPEAIKYILGEKAYELLRSYLFLRYAQLMFDDESFVKHFGQFITHQNPPRPSVAHPAPSTGGPGGGGNPPENQPPPWHGKLPVQFFPLASRHYLQQRPSSSAGRTVSDHPRREHRRLLPLGWQPTKEARDAALREGKNMRYYFEVAFEITDPGFQFQNSDLQTRRQLGEYVFSRADLEHEANARGLSLENFLDQQQKALRERHYTYVKNHEVPGMESTGVIARFRYETGRIANNAAAVTDGLSSRESADIAP